jgi:hypothetical protein
VLSPCAAQPFVEVAAQYGGASPRERVNDDTNRHADKSRFFKPVGLQPLSVQPSPHSAQRKLAEFGSALPHLSRWRGRRVQKCRVKKGFDTASIAHWLGLTLASYEAREAGQIPFGVNELMDLAYKFNVPPSTFAHD